MRLPSPATWTLPDPWFTWLIPGEFWTVFFSRAVGPKKGVQCESQMGRENLLELGPRLKRGARCILANRLPELPESFFLFCIDVRGDRFQIRKIDHDEFPLSDAALNFFYRA